MYVLPEDAHRLEYYTFMIEHLEKKRQKIVQRGRLSEDEDLTLYDIDDTINSMKSLISTLYLKASQPF
jgi:hypothetical protein